ALQCGTVRLGPGRGQFARDPEQHPAGDVVVLGTEHRHRPERRLDVLTTSEGVGRVLEDLDGPATADVVRLTLLHARVDERDLRGVLAGTAELLVRVCVLVVHRDLLDRQAVFLERVGDLLGGEPFRRRGGRGRGRGRRAARRSGGAGFTGLVGAAAGGEE